MEILNGCHKIRFLGSLILCGLFFSVASAKGSEGLPRARLAHLLQLSTERLFEVSEGDSPVFRSFADRNPTSPTFGTELCIVEAKNRNGLLRVIETRTDGPTEETYEQYVPSNAIAAITGGFFGVDDKGNPVPLGFVKVEGKIKNRLHPWSSGGVVITNETGTHILPIKKFKDDKATLNAIQSKPLLVEDGKDGIRTQTPDRYDRSAIATTSDGGVVFAVLFEPGGRAGSLAEFSHLLLNLKTKNGGSIVWALAMDGGPGAHLYIPQMKKHCGAPAVNYVPNLLYLKK